MKLERLNVNKRKIFLCGLILGVVLLATLIIKATWAKYEKSQVIEIATGTVNYKYNPADLEMIAMKQQNDNQTCIEDNTTCYKTIDKMPFGSSYKINTINSYCTLPNSTSKDIGVTLETNGEGRHIMENIQTGAKCYLFFDKDNSLKGKIIAQGATAVSSEPTTDCTTSSCSGLFKQANVTQNGITGTYYYYRGLVSNNWIKFGGHFWRIIGINTNETVRLIYTGTPSNASDISADKASNVTIANDGVTATGTGTQITYYKNGTSGTETNTHVYNTSRNQASYVGWTYSGTSQRPSSSNNDGSVGTKSNVYMIANNWLTNKISSTDRNKIEEGRFCNDRNVANGSTWSPSSSINYAPTNRMVKGIPPTLTCNPGDIYTTKVGLITLDEAKYAGGSKTEANQNYYLYTGQYYWTMSPYVWDGNAVQANMFRVDTNGSIYANDVNSTYGIRPVINLSTTVTVTSGNGTYQTPYVVS